MSNVYPSWWNSAITIYNKYEDPQTNLITWYRTNLKNCFWRYEGEKVIISQSTLETNGTICRIPKSSKFKERYVWNSLGAQKSNYFTIGIKDIVVLGKVTDVINEYQEGSRSTDLVEKYKELQGCIIIDNFAINVGGRRSQEHYYIKGE